MNVLERLLGGVESPRSLEKNAGDFFYHQFFDDALLQYLMEGDNLYSVRGRGIVRKGMVLHDGRYLVSHVPRNQQNVYFEPPGDERYENWGADGEALRQSVPPEYQPQIKRWLDRPYVFFRFKEFGFGGDIPTADVRYLPRSLIVAGIEIDRMEQTKSGFMIPKGISILPDIPNTLGLTGRYIEKMIESYVKVNRFHHNTIL